MYIPLYSTTYTKLQPKPTKNNSPKPPPKIVIIQNLGVDIKGRTTLNSSKLFQSNFEKDKIKIYFFFFFR